jgi:stage IV sporulation protein B
MESGAASTQGEYRLFGAIPVKSVTVKRLQDAKVYVGGIPFGLKFSTKGALVVGFENESSSPDYKAGLRLYDTVTKINGWEIKGATDLTKAIEGGAEVTLTYERAGREATVKFKPGYSESEKRYSLGIYLKDSGAGIGTLTYVLADGSFGGLGHGICDGETGELTPINGGSVLDVCINGIVRGNRGAPGELKGYFNSSKVGSIAKNTECGVFGALASIPEKISDKTYSIGLKGDLNEGAATILCTLDDNVRREYTVEISNINRNATGNKCFTLKVTDPNLIGKTGGIVQGMSGSPIIQNGKLVGAITHVMINDPTVGYGIFIENMISQTTAVEPPTNIAA